MSKMLYILNQAHAKNKVNRNYSRILYYFDEEDYVCFCVFS